MGKAYNNQPQQDNQLNEKSFVKTYYKLKKIII